MIPPIQREPNTIYNGGKDEENKNNIISQPQTNIKQVQYAKEGESANESIKYYFIGVGLFALSFAIYAGVWAIEKFALNHQIASHYYQKTYNWASSVPSSYQQNVASNLKSIALQLVLQWTMWKGPLMAFTYSCVKLNGGILKWVLLAAVVGICAAVDIVLTVFVLNVYNNMMYFGLYSLLTVVAAVIANLSLNRIKQALMDSLFPLLCIALLFAIHNLGLPILYTVYFKNLSTESQLFLTFYSFPIIDLIMYALILFMGKYISNEVKTFYERIHYLLIGYEVGFIILIGYTQVEFYYLCSYLIFRNMFSNWVMWKWEDLVKLPPVFPGWIVPYYFSYVLMFIPFQGIGNLVIGYGFYSVILVNTSTSLYTIPSSLYPSSVYSTGNLTDFSLNTSFNGNIYWISAAIIWVATTFTQKYNKKMPQIGYTIVYNLVGIYLFYLGLCAGVCVGSLTQYSLIA